MNEYMIETDYRDVNAPAGVYGGTHHETAHVFAESAMDAKTKMFDHMHDVGQAPVAMTCTFLRSANSQGSFTYGVGGAR